MKNTLISLCGIASVVTIGCASNAADPEFPVPTVCSGHVERWTDFVSDFISPRIIDVWLPEGYDESQQYPVIYMHDGQMLFDAVHTWNHQEWKVDETLQSLILKGTVPPCIVVGVWNSGEGRYTDYFPKAVFATIPDAFLETMKARAIENQQNPINLDDIDSDGYLKFLTHELKPAIDARYSTYRDRDHTFVAGSSMGGLISLYAICEYPEVFGGAACLSTHWIGVWDDVNNPIPELFASYLQNHLPDPDHHKIYFDHGTETLDGHYARSQRLIDAVMEKGGYNASNWKTLVFQGRDHSELAWADRLAIPLEFLMKTPENLKPAK